MHAVQSVDRARLLVQDSHFAVLDVDLGGFGDSDAFVKEHFPAGNYVRFTANSPDSIPHDCRGFGVVGKTNLEALIDVLRKSMDLAVRRDRNLSP